MKLLYRTMNIYLILGLVAGVFYREFTKFNNFTGDTSLSTLHTHLLALGFLFFLILIGLNQVLHLSDQKYFKLFYGFYNLGFLGLVGTMTWRGIYQVKGLEFVGLSHIAGLTHAFLGLGLLFFSLNLKKAITEAK